MKKLENDALARAKVIFARFADENKLSQLDVNY
jgi:hypothetical protein